jgi:hypothetical protein
VSVQPAPAELATRALQGLAGAPARINEPAAQPDQDQAAERVFAHCVKNRAADRHPNHGPCDIRRVGRVMMLMDDLRLSRQRIAHSGLKAVDSDVFVMGKIPGGLNPCIKLWHKKSTLYVRGYLFRRVKFSSPTSCPSSLMTSVCLGVPT